MRVAKTKALISITVTMKLICAFVFAYAKIWFSHNVAHIYVYNYSTYSTKIASGLKDVTSSICNIHVSADQV